MGRSFWFYPLIIGGVLLAFFTFKTAQKGIEEDKNKPFQEKYLKIYGLINSADKALAQKKDVEAKELYGEAFEQLSELCAEKPDWQPTIVKYRLKYLKEKLGLTPQVTASLSVPEIKGDIGYSENLATEAQKGDVKAQMDLANCYRKGIGIEKNYEKAFYWWQKASEQENQDAEFRVAICFLQGEGVTRDEKAAFKKFLSLAEKGHAKAQFAVGNAYQGGIGVQKNESKAIHWFKKSAENGNADAQNSLGMAYQDGSGVPRNDAEAARWLIQSAEQGNGYGQFLLGNCYAKGRGVEKDPKKAFAYLSKADALGYLNATYNLGYYTEKGFFGKKEFKEALKYYEKCASKNDYDTIKYLGDLYLHGTKLPKDINKAFQYYKKAAEGGDGAGQYALAYMYDLGLGTEKNPVEAKKWYEKSARKNIGASQLALGFIYYRENNHKKAKTFYEKASKNLNAPRDTIVVADESLLIMQVNENKIEKREAFKNYGSLQWYSVLYLPLILLSGWIFVFGKIENKPLLKITSILLGLGGVFNYIIGPLFFRESLPKMGYIQLFIAYLFILLIFFSGWVYAVSKKPCFKKASVGTFYVTGAILFVALSCAIMLIPSRVFNISYVDYKLFGVCLIVLVFLVGILRGIGISKNMETLQIWKNICTGCFWSSFLLSLFLLFWYFLMSDWPLPEKIVSFLLVLFSPIGFIASLKKCKTFIKRALIFLGIVWILFASGVGYKIIKGQICATLYVDAIGIMQKGDLFFGQGDLQKAAASYRDALQRITDISKQNPTWEPEMTRYRSDEITKMIEGISSPSATNPQ